MNETERELLRRALIDLFLATPRKRTLQGHQEDSEEAQREDCTDSRRPAKKPGKEKA
jgi:hypothetical protein